MSSALLAPQADPDPDLRGKGARANAARARMRRVSSTARCAVHNTASSVEAERGTDVPLCRREARHDVERPGVFEIVPQAVEPEWISAQTRSIRGQCLPISAECAPDLVKFGPNSLEDCPNSADSGPKLVRTWPTLVLHRSNTAHTAWSTFADVGPTSVRLGPHL